MKIKMAIKIILYKWAGKLGPFKIKTNCEDCNLTKSIIDDMMQKEFKGKNVSFEIKPWLDNFFYCLFRFTWHAPIIMINGKKFHQFSHKNPLFDRKELEKEVLRK
jgi:predicted methyltransferase